MPLVRLLDGKLKDIVQVGGWAEKVALFDLVEGRGDRADPSWFKTEV